MTYQSILAQESSRTSPSDKGDVAAISLELSPPLILPTLESLVADAWATGLRKPAVDRDADFRTLGLNANRFIQVLREIYFASGIELHINLFFEAPTIRLMAAAILDGCALRSPGAICLRAGAADRPLFVFAGGTSCFVELNELVAALDHPGVIYGITQAGMDGIGPCPDRVEAEAARALAIVTDRQEAGPYRLLGYSVGGLFALETARLLRERGEAVGFLGLVDTVQNDHAWPWPVWLGFVARKGLHSLTSRLRRLAISRKTDTPKRPEASLTPWLAGSPPRRGTQFEFRFRDPHTPHYPHCAPPWVGNYTPNLSRAVERLIRMKGLYTPRRYVGLVSFFVSRGGHHSLCDPRKVWPKHLPSAEWILVPGTHLTMVVGRNALALASAISSRLARTAGQTGSHDRHRGDVEVVRSG